VRLVQFAKKGSKTVSVGAEIPELKAIVDLNAALNLPNLTTRGLLELGEDGLSKVRKIVAEAKKSKKNLVAVSSVNLKSPITDPDKILCVGMNYVDHCKEQNFPIPTEPIIFSKFNNSISGPGDDIILEHTQELDFEVELVIVVGKRGRNILKKDAESYIAGYTVAHDVSARDWQLKKNGGQWLLGKTMDGYCPLGPAIVTKDEIKDPYNLGIRCVLNGKAVQDSNTKNLIFKGGELIEWISKFITISPGDLILTGTGPGVGVFRKPQLFMKDGDVVTCEVDGIGAITNTVRTRRAKL